MDNKTNEIKVSKSSGNVFADLDCKNPEELKLKAKIVASINTMIKRRHIAKAAKLLGISQSQVSDIKKGKLKQFSVERLFDFLNAKF